MNKIKAGTWQGLLIFLIIAATAVLSSCEKYKFNPPAVDPDNPWSLSTDIQPIFNRCTSCHGGATQPDLREGRSHDALTRRGYVTTPGESSRLYRILVDDPSHASRVTEAERLKILYWIEQGAKNN